MTWLTVAVLILAVLLAAYPFVREARRKVMTDTARRAAPGRLARLSRGVTHYRWHGPARGPVAVCVHGLTTPSYVFDGLVEGLAALGYRVLTYDLYGRGWSDRPAGDQDAIFFLEQLEELLADQRVGDDLTLVGYSMGGSIATCFAAAHPDRLRQLVLLAPAGVGNTGDRLAGFVRKTPILGDWLMHMTFPARHRRGTEAERALPSAVPDIVDRQQAELDWRGFVPAVLASLRGILGRTLESEHRRIHTAGVPVLAVWARKDDVIPVAHMGRLAEWSRAARQEVIEEAGHGLTYTHAEEVTAILRARLREGLE